MRKIKESDLYMPVKKHFESLGYKVNGEVLNCDMTALKDNDLIIFEFKLNFNMTLLYQGIDRQKYADKIYLCIPQQQKLSGYKKLTKIKKICNGLSFGLITVDRNYENIKIILEAQNNKTAKSKYKNKITKEINGRSIDLNKGGSTGIKINTAYKELALTIAYLLKLESKASAKILRDKYNLPKNTYNILKRNYNKWYINEEEYGIFSLSNIGETALKAKDNKLLLTTIKKNIKEKQESYS